MKKEETSCGYCGRSEDQEWGMVRPCCDLRQNFSASKPSKDLPLQVGTTPKDSYFTVVPRK
jgi:hypothetical protein